MAKAKTVYVCSACGYESPRWVGKCPGCNAWNTLEETFSSAPEKGPAKVAANQRPGTGAQAMLIRDIPEDSALRTGTGISELDRVLGGGIVEGGLMLIGGDPGIGKSTLLLQVTDRLAKAGQKVLYVRRERVFLTDDNETLISYYLYNHGTDNRSDRERMRKILLRAIRHELTDRQRDCLIKYYLEGMQMTEIARSLSLSKSTVSRHIAAATRKLRNIASYYHR